MTMIHCPLQAVCAILQRWGMDRKVICDRRREGGTMLTTESSLAILAASVFILGMISRNGAAEPVSQAIALLQKGTTSERRHAAEMLARLGDPRAAQPLSQALRD